MARFRNRIVKAEFWTDGELLRWPMAKRVLYQGLWAIAEDSGCLEDDPFEWTAQLFSSPLDRNITLENCEAWRDELVAARKLIPYEAEGKQFLFIRTFHEHEHPRNPQSPGLPLPPWVEWKQTVTEKRDGRAHKVNAYVVNVDLLPRRPGEPEKSVPMSSRAGKGSVPTSGGTGKGSPVLPCPVLPCPDQSRALTAGAPAGSSQIKNGEDTEEEALAPLGAEQEHESEDVGLETLRHAPTCEKRTCDVRMLHVGIRSQVSEIVGSENAGQMYNLATPVHRELAGMAGYICAACWKASAAATMEDRQTLCQRALVAYVDNLVAFHRQKPIRSLPAFLKTRYENMTEAPVPDEILAELRCLERTDSRHDDAVDREATPQRLTGLKDSIPAPSATDDAA